MPGDVISFGIPIFSVGKRPHTPNSIASEVWPLLGPRSYDRDLR